MLGSSCFSTLSSPIFLYIWYCLWSHMHHGNFISDRWTPENTSWRRILMMKADCRSIGLSYYTELYFSLLLLKVVLSRGVKGRLQETFLSKLLFVVLSCIRVTSWPPLLCSLLKLLLLSCPVLVLNLSVRDRSLQTATQYEFSIVTNEILKT